MKKLFPLSFIALMILFLTTSCKDEEPAPEPHPIIGTWLVDSYILSDLPTGFKNYEGFQLVGFHYEQSYTIEFIDNETYSRKIDIIGESNQNDDGTWTIEAQKLTLSPVESNNEFTVEPETVYEDNVLYLSQIYTLSLYPDNVTDTLTRSLTIEESTLYETQVDTKVIHFFER